MADFSALLKTAMGLGVPAERSQAELQLQNLCMSDPSLFFTNLVKELILESNPTDFRQFAGTLIKNSIRLQINNDFLWNLLDSNLRENIKSTLLSTMICKITQIKKSCANAISTIFTVEVLQGRWNNLIDDLTASSQTNIEANIRKAAILTLGQICDKLKEFKLGQLLQEKTKENVLMAILIGLSQEETDLEIRENSIIALGDCVEFMTDILEREQVRDFATGLLIDALQHKNEGVRTTALQRSTDYVKAIYVHFGKYANAMLFATKASIGNEDDEISLPAIEIWTTIASEFQERQTKNAQAANRVQNAVLSNPNHILSVQEELVQLLLQNLLKNSDDEDEAESPIQDASQKALCSIVECVGDAVVNTFAAFISNTISNQQWQYRQAAILAFSSLMEGISQNTILGLINSVLPTFVQTLRDQNMKVRESGAKLVSKIAECHPQTILLRPGIGNELTIILQSLKEAPQISLQICWFFCFLAENLEKYPQNQISGSLDPLISALIENATRNDFTSSNLNVINTSFMSALNFIHFSRDPNISLKYFNLFLQSFNNSYQLPQDRRSTIQSGILSALHTCILGLQNQFDTNMANQVLELVIKYFSAIGDVDFDGMYILSAFSTSVESNLVNYLDKIWPYIQHTLVSKQDDSVLFKACIGAVTDITTSCGMAFAHKLSVLDTFFAALEAPQVNRDVKLSIFSCIGDIILATKQHASDYLPRLIQIYNKSFTAAIELGQHDSTDSQEYAEQLKEQLIESYTCVLHGARESQNKGEFINHSPKLVEFIVFTCKKELHPTVDYVRNCLSLLMDFGNFFQNLATPFIKTQFTKELMNTLLQYDHSKEGKDMFEYATQID